MQPHSTVGIRDGAIGVHQVRLEPGDETAVAGHCRIRISELHHAIVDMAWWNLIWAILYPDPFGLVFAEILGLEIFHVWMLGDYEVYKLISAEDVRRW